jgi:hypothetical protein
MGVDGRADLALECSIVGASEHHGACTDFGSRRRAEALESVSIDPEVLAAENPDRPHYSERTAVAVISIFI